MQYIRNIKNFALLLFSLMFSFTVSYAAGGVVAGEDVELRSGPGNLHGIYEVLTKYAKVDIIGVSGEWAAVKLTDKGLSGFVRADFVVPDEAIAMLPPSSLSPELGEYESDNLVRLPPVPESDVSGFENSFDSKTESGGDLSSEVGSASHTDSSDVDEADMLLSFFGSGEDATEAEKQLVSRAYEFIGVPYVYGGTSSEGLDCSGFVYSVYSGFGYNLPRTAEQQSVVGVWVPRSELRQGDLVFFRTEGHEGIGHVGIYVGMGRFIHAPRSGYSVKVTQLIDDEVDGSYFLKNYVTARRILK